MVHTTHRHRFSFPFKTEQNPKRQQTIATTKTLFSPTEECWVYQPHPRPGLMLRSSWHTKTNSTLLGRRGGGYSLLLCVCFFLMGSGDGTQSPTPSSKYPTDWAISPTPVCFSCSSSYQSRSLLKTHHCPYGLLALRMVLSMIGIVICNSMICGWMTGCVFNDDLIEFCP